MTFTANGKREISPRDHVYPIFAVFSFSVKSSSFAFALKVRISLYYYHLCTHFFKKT